MRFIGGMVYGGQLLTVIYQIDGIAAGLLWVASDGPKRRCGAG